MHVRAARRRALTSFATVLLAVAPLALASRPALAHATLVRAIPAPGSRLATSPPRVRLEFSEELDAGLSRLTLSGASGPTMILRSERDPRDVHALVAELPALGPGDYAVRWHVVSADGHPVDGVLRFGVGRGTTTPARTPGEPGAQAAAADEDAVAPYAAALLRGLAVGCVMALVGLLAMSVTGGSPPEPATGSAARLLVTATPLLLVAHAFLWLRNAAPDHQLTNDVVQAGLASPAGRVEAWRCGAAVLSAWALLLARRWTLALLFAVVALALGGATGHAAASPVLGVPAKVVHLSAGAAWLGGILWLVTRDRSDTPRFERDARRVSSVALAAVVLVAASGIAQLLLFVPTSHALLHTRYGQLALVKVALLVVLVGYGAHHRFRSLERLRRAPSAAPRFIGTLRQELAVLALVTLVGGLLAYTPTSVPAPIAAPSTSPP